MFVYVSDFSQWDNTDDSTSEEQWNSTDNSTSEQWDSTDNSTSGGQSENQENGGGESNNVELWNCLNQCYWSDQECRDVCNMHYQPIYDEITNCQDNCEPTDIDCLDMCNEQQNDIDPDSASGD